MKKKADMSVNIIITIALGLIILGVLVFLLGGKVKQFGTSTNSCAEKQGACVEKAENCNGPIIGSLDCPKQLAKETAVCCQKVS